MLIAVVATLLHKDDHQLRVDHRRPGRRLGHRHGDLALRIPMTKMPERIAFSHAFGGARDGARRRERVHQDAGARLAPRDGRARLRGVPRLPHVHRQHHGVREAPGLHHRRAGHVQRAELRQHRPLLRHARPARRAGRSPGRAPASCSTRRAAIGLVARRHGRPADRRRRHAGRHLAPQLVRRASRRRRPASRSRATSSSSRARSTARRGSSCRS